MALVLDVHLEGNHQPIGQLMRAGDGSTAFRYASDALPYALSLSLPLQEAPFGDAATKAFFSNLLFENAMRDQISERHQLDYGDIVGLLFHLGRDCPGAVSCVPAGEGPAKQPGNLETDYDRLTQTDLQEIMLSLRDRRRIPDHTRDPSPLAGVQGKVALTMLPDGSFALPKAGLNVPTSHILKVPRLADMGSVGKEHLLTSLMKEFQAYPVSQTEIIGEGDLKGLLIKRFDRTLDGSMISRIHQEDFAQGLGLSPSLKYERNGTFGHRFSAKAVGALLQQTESPGLSRAAFLDISLVNLMLGNTDNHAKNHALLYLGPRPRLAPAYDIFPTLIDDQVTHQLAFDVGAAKMADDITAGDLEQMIHDLGFPRLTPALRRHVTGIVANIINCINTMQGPERKRIGDAMAEQTRHMVSALKMDLAVPERDALIINRP